MLSLALGGRTRLCDSWTRRELLQVGGLGTLGLTLPGMLRAEAAGLVGGKKRAKSVIMIYNRGAPSHIALWDMKPNAPAEVRGEFKPIDTNVPGIRISELLPRLAKQADKYAIVRSVHHRQAQHNSGMYNTIVGRAYPIDSTLINPSVNDYPSFGTLVGWLARKNGYSGALPPYVITPAPHCDSTVYITPGQYGGMLGREHDPFVLNGDPNKRDFKVQSLEPVAGITVDRMRGRQNLLRSVDQTARAFENAAIRDLDTAQE